MNHPIDPDHIEDAAQEILHQARMHGVSDNFSVSLPEGVHRSEFLKNTHRELSRQLHILEDQYSETRLQAWRYLGSGFFFLGICLAISQVTKHTAVIFDDLIGESVMVAGWVGMWRPLELFLYELPELRKQKMLLRNLLQSSFFSQG